MHIPQKMDLEYADLKTQLGVAMRFVEWFTHRGETYEHNMKLIDKHLHGMASTASDPKNRQVIIEVIVLIVLITYFLTLL
jgi:hypothetical protein